MLDSAQWQHRLDAHIKAADERIADHVARRAKQQSHPVYDFLFEYYPVRPSHLRRWHPGLEPLHDPERKAPHTNWKYYTRNDDVVTIDAPLLLKKRGSALTYIHSLLRQTTQNQAQFSCFGLHEWAMVYRSDNLRHDLPLRLSKQETNQVVEDHKIICSHYDAYRFFTPPAKPLNLTVLTRQSQPEHDQPGCVHVNMDLYKWASKLGPLVPGEFLLQAFDLAKDARVLDMEASPYDCTGYGFSYVAIEAAEGKAEYVRRQRELSARGESIRSQLVAILDRFL